LFFLPRSVFFQQSHHEHFEEGNQPSTINHPLHQQALLKKILLK
jgi:hypothetical protein